MQKLEQAINQRTEKNYTESEKLFLELVLEDKKNASIHYHFAWLSDNMGLEKRAIKHYKKALKFGLDVEFRADWFLGLGSSYRMTGKFKKSVKIFDLAIQKFPEHNELQVFKSLSLFELKKEKKAYLELLEVLLKVNNDKNIDALSNALNGFIQSKS